MNAQIVSGNINIKAFTPSAKPELIIKYLPGLLHRVKIFAGIVRFPVPRSGYKPAGGRY